MAEPTVVSSSLGLESSVGYSYLFPSSKCSFADTASIIPLEYSQLIVSCYNFEKYSKFSKTHSIYSLNHLPRALSFKKNLSASAIPSINLLTYHLYM